MAYHEADTVLEVAGRGAERYGDGPPGGGAFFPGTPLEKQNRNLGSCFVGEILAERVGFEPTVRGYRTPDFESGTFDHSATSPGPCSGLALLLLRGALSVVDKLAVFAAFLAAFPDC